MATRAASESAVLEAEGALVVAPARTVNDSAASGGRALVFGNATEPAAPPTPPPPPPAPVPSVGSPGPSGAWPVGFPAYSSAQTVTTNGSVADLSAKINQLSGGGGIIQHASGAFPGKITRTSGSAPIVIRPPLGQRANFTLTGDIHIGSPGILLAGYAQEGGNVWVESVMNSGMAWIEGKGQGGGFWVRAGGFGYANASAKGLFYEIVYPNFQSKDGDRTGLQAINGKRADMVVVGSWITGTDGLPWTGPNAAKGPHSDTFQVYTPGGDGFISFNNSVIMASGHNALQGEGNDNVYEVRNSMLLSPGGVIAALGRNPYRCTNGSACQHGYNAATAVINTFDNNVLWGAVHGGFAVRATNSKLYQTSGVVNVSGNTILQAAPALPPVMTHAMLDAVWHN